MAFGGVGMYGLGAYLTYGYFKMTSAPSHATLLEHLELESAAENCGCTDHSHVFNDIAASYDQRINTDETLMGIKFLRWRLLRGARGRVLELGGGTGRNLGYYPPGRVKSIVVTDSNPNMLLETAKKGRQRGMTVVEVGDLQPETETDSETKEAGGLGIVLTVEQVDAHRLPFDDNSFDTVVDTFGLCSYARPDEVLLEMQRVCKDQSQGGQLLLLEHGRSSWCSFITNMLDKGALRHAQTWGCWWNRDIQQLIADSGVDMTGHTTWHMGTTHYIKAYNRRPKPSRDF